MVSNFKSAIFFVHCLYLSRNPIETSYLPVVRWMLSIYSMKSISFVHALAELFRYFFIQLQICHALSFNKMIKKSDRDLPVVRCHASPPHLSFLPRVHTPTADQTYNWLPGGGRELHSVTRSLSCLVLPLFRAPCSGSCSCWRPPPSTSGPAPSPYWACTTGRVRGQCQQTPVSCMWCLLNWVLKENLADFTLYYLAKLARKQKKRRSSQFKVSYSF